MTEHVGHQPDRRLGDGIQCRHQPLRPGRGGASYGFNLPFGIAFDGLHLWVTNATGNSVTEISQVDGSLVQVLAGAAYGFNGPDGAAFDGSRMWFTSSGGNSVTDVPVS